MSLYSILSYIAFLFCLGLAMLALARDRKGLVQWIFAAGMIVLGLEAMLVGIGFKASLPAEAKYWQRIRLITIAFLPGAWLLFSLTYARVNYKEIISKWRWVVLAAFIIPLTLVTFFWKSFFMGEPVLDSPLSWFIRLG